MTRPRVLVLLALYNGMPYLPEQVESILGQTDVDVRIAVSDDGSRDGSVEWLRERAAAGAPIEILPTVAPSGSAAANFRRLIRDAPLDAAGPGELVSFADQDDVWHADKLARHAAIVAEGAHFVSSNVTAFHEDGRRSLIKKDWPMRRWDFLAESAGPGSTYLMSPTAFALVRRAVAEVPEAEQTDFHDSMVHAIGRASGLRWVIDGAPSLDYRQHGGNVIGANSGIRAATMRFRLIREHWHREQAVLLARLALEVAERLAPESGPADAMRPIDVDALRRVLELFEQRGPKARIRLARGADQLRRRPRDRAILRSLILAGIW